MVKRRIDKKIPINKIVLHNRKKGLVKDNEKLSKDKETVNLFSLILNQSNNAIAILNRNGIIEYANPKLLSVYNYPAEKVIGQRQDNRRPERGYPQSN